MQFSAFFLCTSPDLSPAEEVYAEALDFVRLAEELGYDSVWFAEHHFSNYGYIPNPLLFIVRAAQRQNVYGWALGSWSSHSGIRFAWPKTSR